MNECNVHHTDTHECDCGETWKVGELAEAQGKLEALSEGLVRTGKWALLPQPPGYLMCRVCCTGMRCECGPGEHVSREGCPNCLGKSGSIFIGGSKERE